ncbi:hypothetical protein [Methylotenera sp.]|uniref:hypothetical protein n=1 Tax=Methylotenera sp. TaxID=2051956 RepID=UPI00248A540A|nr:hypothetical protein [Methylotenera sp.]MDI1360753.1 hypothetical protein [Methylotenera sp.]
MRNKLLTALLVSVFAHVILIFNLSMAKNSNFSKRDLRGKLLISSLSAPALQVGFLTKPLPSQNKQELNNKSNIGDDMHTGLNSSLPIKPQGEHTHPLVGLAHSDISGTEELKQYYKVSEVDMSAIPQHGIESPISEYKLLEVYQLGVFINKNGSVDKVVNLIEGKKPQLFYTKIEEQVKNLTFIPAKKNGIEVDSYIEIALEM